MSDLTAIAQDRFGLGARPDQRVEGDPRDWLLSQFSRYDPSPAIIAQEPDSGEMLTRMITYRRARGQMRRENRRREEEAMAAGGPAMAQEPEEQAQSRRNLRVAYASGASARVANALVTDTAMIERLVHFWANHFAVSADKGTVTPLVASYEFEAIRPHVLGNFSALLRAAVLHPAMLNYLDQTQSIGPASDLARRRAQRPRRDGQGREIGINENLAREILELHTLGVRSGYSQDDVTEFARALTGWTISGFSGGRTLRERDIAPGKLAFYEVLHEPGPRRILGKQYSASGRDQSLAILDDLAQSPLTARFIALKLARHFVSDTPPESIIARLERAFLASGGELTAVYEALITAPEPWANANTKFRNPWDWMLAALRTVGMEQMPGRRAALNAFEQLGQPVWKPGSPAGFADLTSEWAGPGALIARVEYAHQIAQNAGNQLDARDLAQSFLAGKLGPDTLQAIRRSESPSTGLALMIASPDFMRR